VPPVQYWINSTLNPQWALRPDRKCNNYNFVSRDTAFSPAVIYGPCSDVHFKIKPCLSYLVCTTSTTRWLEVRPTFILNFKMQEIQERARGTHQPPRQCARASSTRAEYGRPCERRPRFHFKWRPSVRSGKTISTGPLLHLARVRKADFECTSVRPARILRLALTAIAC